MGFTAVYLDLANIYIRLTDSLKKSTDRHILLHCQSHTHTHTHVGPSVNHTGVEKCENALLLCRICDCLCVCQCQGWEGVWMGAVRPCPPFRNNIITRLVMGDEVSKYPDRPILIQALSRHLTLTLWAFYKSYSFPHWLPINSYSLRAHWNRDSDSSSFRAKSSEQTSTSIQDYSRYFIFFF